MGGKTSVGVVFPIATPVGTGYSVINSRDADRLLTERNPKYGQNINAPYLVKREGPIPMNDAKRYVGGIYRSPEDAREFHKQYSEILTVDEWWSQTRGNK